MTTGAEVWLTSKTLDQPVFVPGQHSSQTGVTTIIESSSSLWWIKLLSIDRTVIQHTGIMDRLWETTAHVYELDTMVADGLKLDGCE